MPTGPAQVRAVGSARDATRNFFDSEVRNDEKQRRVTLGLTEDDELPPYVHQDYPKALYPETEGDDPIVVANPEEEAVKLHAGYFATLAEAKEHYANGDGEADEEDSDEGEILVAAEGAVAPAPHPARKRRPLSARKRRRRPSPHTVTAAAEVNAD